MNFENIFMFVYNPCYLSSLAVFNYIYLDIFLPDETGKDNITNVLLIQSDHLINYSPES